MSDIRSPVIRYVCKLLANTFFARREAGKVTTKELCLIYQGLKPLLSEFWGDVYKYEFGDDINYGCIFANELTQYKKRVRTDIPHVYIGSMITPLLVKAGLDITGLKPKEVNGFEYISKDYLVQTHFLKGKTEANLFLYNIQLRNTAKKLLKLPRKDLTSIATMEGVRFEIGEEDLLEVNDIHGIPGVGGSGARETDSEAGGSHSEAGGSRGYMAQLDEHELPEIDFAPKTNRERLIHQAYKAQRAINKFQKKLISKLFKNVKKIQQRTNVSSDEDDDPEATHEEAAPEDDE